MINKNESLVIPELNGAKIRKTDDGRFSVYDLIRVAGGQKSPRKVWKRLQEAYPELLGKTESEYLGQGKARKKTPVATLDDCETILRFIKKHPSQLPYTSDRFYPRTEEQIVSVLLEAFYDCEPCTQFFVSGYRIDLYLVKPRIAVECDEWGHNNYCKKQEIKRQREIKRSLGCSFVRFDPYSDGFNIGKVIASIRDLLPPHKALFCENPTARELLGE